MTTNNNNIPPKVFITYSWDSPKHKENVLIFSDTLRKCGLDSTIDQYVSFPEKGWPRWMEEQIEKADFVLIICTEKYTEKFNLAPNKGKGVIWESQIIYNHLYNCGGVNQKFIPVIFSQEDDKHIPNILNSYTHYVISDCSKLEGFIDLYNHLTGQSVKIPDIGQLGLIALSHRKINPFHIIGRGFLNFPVLTFIIISLAFPLGFASIRLQGEAQTTQKCLGLQNVPIGLFSYGGSTTWAPITQKVDKMIEEGCSEFKLRYTKSLNRTPSSGDGIQMLINGDLDFALSSRGITDEEIAKAKERRYSLINIPVAINARAIVVNPNLNIRGLTKTQVDEIYKGNITNWREVGGPNLRIQPYDTYGVQIPNSNIVKLMPTPTEAIREVAKNRAGIFTGSASILLPQCKVFPLPMFNDEKTKLVPSYKEPFVPLSECPKKRNQPNLEAFLSGEYPDTRRLSVVIKENGGREEKAGRFYADLILSSKGQQLIEEAGFVKIKGFSTDIK